MSGLLALMAGNVSLLPSIKFKKSRSCWVAPANKSLRLTLEFSSTPATVNAPILNREALLPRDTSFNIS